MKKKNFLLLLFVALLQFPQLAHAQAYDGDDDRKLFLGYLNFGGRSGFEIGYDTGFSDEFSIALYGSMIPKSGDDTYDVIRGYDLGAQFNLHWVYILKLPSKLDIYMGPKISFTNGGIGAGVRYNFSENWGLYAYGQQNFFTIFDHNLEDEGYSPYHNKFGISVGITFSFF